MLISLVTAQRVQSLHVLDTANMIQQDKNILFQLDIIKQSKPTVKSTFIELNEYPHDDKICVVKTVRCYLERTASLRGKETKLFITYAKPYHGASRDTLRRCLKSCMAQAKIDTQVFTAHSTRAASASAAVKSGLPVNQILARAGWSSETTFARHYNVPVQSNKASEFAEAVFNN